MDVRCARCGTEYEFDDALVSERGTTVKCTNCGHQFKVHPTQSAAVPERWVVRTASGRELVYTTLRELQRGIAQRQVGPEDLLARGNQPPRPLGSIAELEPFFQGRAGNSLRNAAQPRTLAGVAPPPPGSFVGPNPAGQSVAGPFPLGAVQVPKIADPAAPTRPVNEAMRPVDPMGDTHPEVDRDPPTVPRNQTPPPPPARPRPEVAPAEPAMQPVPSPRVLMDSLPDGSMTPTPSDVRMGYRGVEDAADSRYLPQSRRLRSRWIAGLVIVGVGVLLAATVGRRYLERYKAATPTPSATADGRVAGFLTEAERKLDEGDFEGAREQLDKASVLAEKDPAVLAALARLEAMRADVVWLRVRLLDPADKQLVQSTYRQLGARVGKAKETLERAVAVAPDNPAVVRAHVDILRLAGELKEARALVGPLSASPTGENAYVLAALDLAEAQPVWSSVIDRLRTASTAERGLGRARSALVYALVRSGQVSEAKSELAKVADRASTHPLWDDLQSFVGRFTETSDAGSDGGGVEVATVDPASLPVLDTRQGTEPPEPPPKPGEFRWQLQHAAAAMKQGNLDRAEQLYNAVLSQDPKNTEALSGLAEVAKLRHDPDSAAKMYEKVLKDNPNYLPALTASADSKWDSGDRKGAIAIYRRVLEQAGASSSYGQHAAQRISEGEGSSSGGSSGTTAPSTKPSTSAKPPEKPPEEKPKNDTPGIDTSDLPGFK